MQMKNCDPLVSGPALAMATCRQVLAPDGPRRTCSRALPAGALGITALDHELGHHPVERESAVAARASEGDEVVHGVGRQRGIEPMLMAPRLVSMTTW